MEELDAGGVDGAPVGLRLALVDGEDVPLGVDQALVGEALPPLDEVDEGAARPALLRHGEGGPAGGGEEVTGRHRFFTGFTGFQQLIEVEQEGDVVASVAGLHVVYSFCSLLQYYYNKTAARVHNFF